MKKSFVLLTTLAALFVASCTGLVDSYTVDGTGLDWENQPVQVIEPERVTPNVNVSLPDRIGGGVITVPIRVTPTK